MSKRSMVTMLAVSAACILVLLRYHTISHVQRDAPASLLGIIEHRRLCGRDCTFNNIYNETLGFENVYAIGLKERTDRRDFVTLAASIVGFRIEWIDGVHGEDITPKALPERFNVQQTKPGVAGCWRAHMNALVKVIERRQSTALIIEDDADWDVNIKSQLVEFARGVHALNGEQHPTKDAPYGTEWDLLWIGGCASGPFENETEFYVIPNDPTAPAMKHRGGWGGPLETWKQKFPEDSSRYVYRARMGCCTYGYAVTYNGARRILASLSVDHLEAAVDNAMSDLCAGENGYPRIACLAPFPNLIGTFRQGGSSARDSDIENADNPQYHDAVSWNIVYSARLNVYRMIGIEQTVISQWKDDEVPWSSSELDLSKSQYPRGYYVSL